ncbi:MAG: hypothetical protein AAFY59_14100, partial [Pseudomonadota bacterium]
AVVLRFDIRDFFPSITAARIHALFRCLGYPHTVARALTGLTTTVTHPNILTRLSPTQRRDFARPHLPQGAPTSPALANLAAFKLDRRLSGLARSKGASYTRYAGFAGICGEAFLCKSSGYGFEEAWRDLRIAGEGKIIRIACVAGASATGEAA